MLSICLRQKVSICLAYAYKHCPLDDVYGSVFRLLPKLTKSLPKLSYVPESRSCVKGRTA